MILRKAVLSSAASLSLWTIALHNSMTTTSAHAPSLTTTMTQRRPVKAILFDMDGTLLDTETLSDKAVLLAFGESLPKEVFNSLNNRLPWDAKKKTLGLRGEAWIPMVLEYGAKHWNVDQNTVPTWQEFWPRWESGLNNMCEEIDECPGATALVEALSIQKVPMAIATSSRYSAVEKKRKRHEAIFKHLDTVVAGDDLAVKNGKPAPDIYIEAAKRLGVDPSDCLVFEDALSGVRAGKAAGCQVVAVPDPRFEGDPDQQPFLDEADVVLGSLWDFDGTEFGIDVKMASLLKPKESSECES